MNRAPIASNCFNNESSAVFGGILGSVRGLGGVLDKSLRESYNMVGIEKCL